MSNPDIPVKETIDMVHSLFLERSNSRPIDSAKYFVIYTLLGFGCTFTGILNEQKEVFRLKGFQGRRKMESGRESLVKDGMLANILYNHRINFEDEEEARIFQGEQYLPVNPKLIYKDVSQRHGGQYELLGDYYGLLEHLYEYWKWNFREHGFLIKEGILTIYCTVPWLLFSLWNYLSIWEGKEETLYIVTPNASWSLPPLFPSFVSSLEKGLKLKVLLDVSRKTDELMQLKQKGQVEIRNLPKGYIITNRLAFVGHTYVVDMHKISGMAAEYSPYIATIYINMRDIAEQFKASFEERWQNASLY
jgi:hypothetical protein